MASKLYDGSVGDFDWATNDNWTTSGEPGASGDSGFFNHDSASKVNGSDQSGVTLDLLSIPMTYLFDWGSAATPMKVGATIAKFGEPGGAATAATGPPRINWDAHTIQTALYVYNSKSGGTDAGKEVIRVKGVNAANLAYISGGRVGFATDAIGDVATWLTINQTAGVVNLGAGVTLANYNIAGGTGTIKNTITTVSQSGGGLSSTGDYTITTFSLSAATFTCNHRKTAGASITTLNLYDGAVLDLSGNAAAVAITTINLLGNATIRTNKSSPGHLSWTTLTRTRGQLTIT